MFKLFDDYDGPENCVIIKMEIYSCNNKQDALNKEGKYIFNNKYNKPTFHCNICNEILYNSNKNKHENTQKHLNNINRQNNIQTDNNIISNKKIYYCECGNEKYKYADNCNECKNKNKVIQSIKLKETISIVKIGEIYNVSDKIVLENELNYMKSMIY